MARSFGEPLTKLRAVPIEDNGEPLVDPRSLSKRIHFAEKHPKYEDIQCTPKVRRRVAEMLAAAAVSLPDGTDIVIFEGFRSQVQQQFMYGEVKAEFAKRHPEWNESTLRRMTHTLAAPPDDPCPPPHLTGGAVDLCLMQMPSREWLDMTAPFAADETSAPSRMKGLSRQAQENRALLFNALEKAGLTNYAGEWWHWSYGDSGWALRVGAKAAVYDRLAEGTPEDAGGDLTLREFGRGDFDRLISWVDSPEAMRDWAAVFFTYPLTVEQLEKYQTEAEREERRLWTAIDTQNGEAVGHIEMSYIVPHLSGFVSRVLVAPHRRGQGLGEKMMRRLTTLAFEEHGFHHLNLGVISTNAAAIRCYTRIGFQQVGEWPDAMPTPTGTVAIVWMMLYRTDWERRRSA